MRSFLRFGRITALVMALVMLVVSLPLGVARARLVTTDQVIGVLSAERERDQIQAFLGRADVQAQMVALGVDTAEAAARIATLSDDEIRQIAGQLDRLPAGQDAATIALVILSIFVFLIILQVLGAVNIFSFVKSPGDSGPGR